MTRMFLGMAIVCALLLTGCGDDGSSSGGSQTGRAQPTAPGKISISAGPVVKRQSEDQFRTYDIKGESQISYAPDGQEITKEVKNVQVVVAARNKTPLELIGERLIIGTLSKDFMVWCSACHDDYGNGVIGPSIMNKTSKEIRDKIEEYRGNAEANVLMTDLVNRISKEKVEFISSDIARFNEAVKKLKAGKKETEKWMPDSQ